MNSRRQFLKMGVTAVAVGSVLKSVSALAEEKRRGGGDTKSADSNMVDEKSPAAQGVKYHADITKVKDKTVMIDRQGVKFKDQKCSGCGLYTGKPGDKTGPCMVFPGKQVTANGFCTSWNKKA